MFPMFDYLIGTIVAAVILFLLGMPLEIILFAGLSTTTLGFILSWIFGGY